MAQAHATSLGASALHLQDRLDRLRTSALDLLEEMVGEGFAADSVLSGAVAEVQDAVNRLAAAETALSASRAQNGPVWTVAEQTIDPPPSQDAAIVLALAATTVPSATSGVDEAERWLRVLRPHGRVGAALEELGVTLAPLETIAELNPSSRDGHERVEVAEVIRRAATVARARGAETLDTIDVLAAVVDAHRGRFERALYARGTTMKDLLEHLPQAERVPTQA